ncbi:MAG: hypothetical protein WKG01_29285 [Kofleriaceae bacterium]
MKKTSKLALNPSTIRVLSGDLLTHASGGISGRMGCNFSNEGCDPTFNTCDISYAPICNTGSCNSLACTTG